jgi:hypothetical protein
MLAGHDVDYVRIVWVIACAFGFSVIACLVVVYRRALRRHELEQAEQTISLHDREADRAPDPHE